MAVPATIFVDLICPFCYLALAALARLEAEGGVRVRVVPFEIHPETPRGGRPLAEVAGRRADRIFREIGWLANEAGVTVVKPERLPSSRLALEGVEAARAAKGEAGAAAFAWRALRAYFAEGADIGEEATLRAIATEVGVPKETQEKWLLVRAFGRAVDAGRREAEEKLVTAVPATFLGAFPLLGLQPYERLKQVAARASHSASPRP